MKISTTTAGGANERKRRDVTLPNIIQVPFIPHHFEKQPSTSPVPSPSPYPKSCLKQTLWWVERIEGSHLDTPQLLMEELGTNRCSWTRVCTFPSSRGQEETILFVVKACCHAPSSPHHSITILSTVPKLNFLQQNTKLYGRGNN
jgi:hypothetical protein